MKKNGLALASGIFLLAWIFLLIRCMMPCKTYEYEGSFSFASGAAADEAVYEGIDLSPGVYRIQLEYQTLEDEASYASASDSSVITGGLLTNYELFYSQLGYTDFEVWLFERANDFHVTVHHTGRGDLTTGRLVIRETNLLWTMLMASLLFLWILFLLLHVYVQRVRDGKISGEKKQVIFWIFVISFLASIPFLSGFSIPAGDLGYHLLRIEGVKDGLLSGQIPVRLEPDWLYEHGYASGIFYCDLYLLLPALLRMLGFPVSFSYNIYCIAVNIATAWVAYSCFRKMFQSDRIGLTCSALYVLSLNRLYKLYNIAVVGEYTAALFLPLIAYGFYLIFTEDVKSEKYKRAWIPLAAGLAGIIHCHVLTCEITAFIIALFCLLYLRRVLVPETFLVLAKAALFSLLCSAWFLVPFLDYYLTQDMQVKHASGRTIQASGLTLTDLLQHFVKAGRGVKTATPPHDHPCSVGLILILVLGMFFVLWFMGSFRDQKKDERFVFVKYMALLGAALLFMSLSAFPWDRIQALGSIAASLVSSLQFPNRMLGWATLCLVITFGYCMYYFRERNVKAASLLLLLAGISVATSSMYLIDYSANNTDTFVLYNPGGMGNGYISGREYLIWGTDYDALSYAKPEAGEGVTISAYQKRPLGAEFTCENYFETEGYAELPLLLYKGYQAMDEGTGERLDVVFGSNNEVRVLLPPEYAGHVIVRFVSPFYWRIAEVISLLTILALACQKGRFLLTRKSAE